MRPARWSLRWRITALATCVMALGLAIGATALAALFARERVATVDRRLHEESRALVALAQSGQLPAPLPASPGVFAQVLDPAGTVLAASASASRVVALVPESPVVPRTFTTADSTVGDERLRVAVALAADGPVRFTVVVASPLTDLDEGVRALRRVMVLLVPLVVGAVATATWIAVGSALQPVDSLRAAAERVVDVRGPVAPQLPVAPTGDELERLGTTLNLMLSRLHVADERQRSFIADAAHELRTPVASALTQVEVAIGAASESSGDEVVLRDVLVDIERLRRLVDDLLLLARLDAAPPQRREPVDLARYADEPGPPVLVEADPVALARAVDNIVANARRHARSVVRVSVRVVGPDAVLAVDDDGAGIAPEDRQRVFDRWTRLDDGRGRDEGGTGLGLAIARSVAEAHGGTLTVGESHLGGGRLELRIPG